MERSVSASLRGNVGILFFLKCCEKDVVRGYKILAVFVVSQKIFHFDKGGARTSLLCRFEIVPPTPSITSIGTPETARHTNKSLTDVSAVSFEIVVLSCRPPSISAGAVSSKNPTSSTVLASPSWIHEPDDPDNTKAGKQHQPVLPLPLLSSHRSRHRWRHRGRPLSSL
jgi:hypothetical protein